MVLETNNPALAHGESAVPRGGQSSKLGLGAGAILEFLGIGILYFLLAKGGLALASINPSATPIWPPTGLALAAVILRGYRVGTAIFLAAFLANATTTGSMLSSGAIALGNTLECLVGGYLINRWAGGQAAFETPTGVARFFLASLLVATPLSATIGVGALVVAGEADPARLVPIWVTWWLGDLAGALIVTPAVVLWSLARLRSLSRRDMLESALAFGATTAVGLIAFSPILDRSSIRDPLGFLAIMPLMWTAMRRNQRDTVTVVLILSCFAVWGTDVHGGPFARPELNESFLLLVMFLISISVPSLALSADAAMRRRAEDGLRREQQELDRRVQERTKALEAAQEQLQHAQRMDSLGQLTGGIAHEFNNVLTAILTSLESMKKSVTADAKQLRRLDRAWEAARNGAALVQQLLMFARKQSPRVVPTDINRLIATTLETFGRSLAENIRVLQRLEPKLGWVRADATLLQTAILNLVTNARDALPAGGRITICSLNLPRGTRFPVELPAGDYVAITVSDEGSGMAPEIRARAFEPFFTTKEIGKGTGLGLSMVYSATRQMGGQVHIESELGKGTSVQLILPAIPAPEPVVEGTASYPREKDEGLEHRALLYVEDDTLVSLATVDMLESAGHRVHAVAEAKHALAVLEEQPEVELLVTDIGLPGMNGRQLAAEARVRRPGLKVLFLSGHDPTAPMGEWVEDTHTKYLQKPYQEEALLDAVRHFLARDGRRSKS